MKLDRGYVHGGDIYRHKIRLDFSANVNPFGTPEKVKEAVRKAAENMAVYPDPYCTALRINLAEKHSISPENIICGNGAAELIFQFSLALSPRLALLPVPSFSEYETALLSAGCDIKYHCLKRENAFAPDERILDEITPCTDVVFFCNPNNPTGQMIDRPLLSEIMKRCRQTGTWLFLDECFYDLTDEALAYSLIDKLKENDRVFILRAFTKTYGLAGVRLGYAVCKNTDLLEKICARSQSWNVSNLAQAAGCAALECETWAEKARELFAKEKDYMTNELAKLDVKYIRGAANFCMIEEQPSLYDRLLDMGILVRDCSNYRGLIKGDVRFCIRTHRENEQLIAAIREV